MRSGIGFGGAALSLPLLLLVDNNPVFFLPVIGFHLLFFTSITIRARLDNIDWMFVRRSMLIIIIPKLIGLFGLLTMSAKWLTLIVFSITLIYGALWLLDITIRSKSKAVDIGLLALGGYVSGTSLIGAPLIVAVAIQHVEKLKLRDTLFAIWIILVILKMGAFIAAGVDLQWKLALLLLPMAGVGHFIGLKANAALMHGDDRTFHRVLGGVLVIISVLGLYKQFV